MAALDSSGGHVESASGFDADLEALLRDIQGGGEFINGGDEGGNFWAPSNLGNLDDFGSSSTSGGFVLDTETGEVISIEEAMRRDPSALTDEQIRSIRDSGLTSDTSGFQEGNRTVDNPQGASGVTRMLNAVKSGKDLIGLALTGGLGLAGLLMAGQGLTSSGNGGASLQLPDGRTIQLSPQEAELLNLAVRQAQQQANISDKTLGAVNAAVDQAAPDITTTLAAGARTAGVQAGAQGKMTDATSGALFAPEAAPFQGTPEQVEAIGYAANNNGTYFADQVDAATAYARAVQAGRVAKTSTAAGAMITGDLANERGLQGVQTSAISNLRGLIDPDPTAEQALGTQVGSAADLETKRLIEGGTLDPSMEDLRPLGTAARNAVGSYITGTSEVPGMYAGEDDIRTTANARLRAGLDATEAVNPAIKRQIAERYEQLQRQMLRDVGPGWEMSTPGQLALRDFETWKSETVYGGNLAETTAMSNLALPRGQFLEGVQSGRAATAAPFVTGIPTLLDSSRRSNISNLSSIGTTQRQVDETARSNRFARNEAVANQTGRATSNIGRIFGIGQAGAPSSSGAIATMLGESPGALANSTFSNLASVGNFQEGTANQNAITQALLEAQRRNQMLTGGGQLIGQAVSPFIQSAAKSFFA